MKQIWRATFAAASMTVLLTPAVMAQISVGTDNTVIQDIGGKTHFTEASPATAFDDGIGAHEVIGRIDFSADDGQAPIDGFGFNGPADICNGSGASIADGTAGDFDIPDPMFGCTTYDTTDIDLDTIPDACEVAGPFPYSPLTANTACEIAPDITGRLDSVSCSNAWTPIYAAPGVASAVMPALNGNFACNLLGARARDFFFFNYMACYPTIECFNKDPFGNTDCDQGGAGPFDSVGAIDAGSGGTTLVDLDGDTVAEAIPDDSGVDPSDIWIAGGIVHIRMPHGVRLANTLYPGMMLKGDNQYDAFSAYSPLIDPAARIDIPVDDTLAWPAVIYDFEANHLVNDPGSLADFTSPGALNGTQFDEIDIFVPDILSDRATSINTLAVFTIGENEVGDPFNVIPPDRDLVENCYREGDPLTGLCVASPYYMDGFPDRACDYDTTICVDIRGSSNPVRVSSVIMNPFRVTLEGPSSSTVQFSPSVVEVADISPRALPDDEEVLITADAPAIPSCEGYIFCAIEDTDGDGDINDIGIDTVFPDPDSDYGYIWIPNGEAGALVIDESSAGLVGIGEQLICTIVQDNVTFVDIDDTVTSTVPGLGICNELWPVDFSEIAIDAAEGNGLDGVVNLTDSDDETLVIDFTSSSSGTGGEIEISGFELLVRNDALPGGFGCIQLDCNLDIPGGECPNHVGVVNFPDNDEDNRHGILADEHYPSLGAVNADEVINIACITPGRTVLLYPYMVKGLAFDTGIAVTNTSTAPGIVHFYLFEEEGVNNVSTNPPLEVLNCENPENLSPDATDESSFCTDETLQSLYVQYNEIPALGQYVNLVFAAEGDDITKVKNSERVVADPSDCTNYSSGIFPFEVLNEIDSDVDCIDATPDGTVWMYAVVEQCYSHGYQMVFSDGGFGSTLALVDNETALLPYAEEDVDGETVLRLTTRDVAEGYMPVHTPPARYITFNQTIQMGLDANANGFIDPPPSFYSTITIEGDREVRSYNFWNGNDE